MVPRKVLMLHGFSQNGAIFSKRMGAIRKACGKDVDLVFVDAPHVLKPVDLGNSTVSSLEALNSPEASVNPTDPTEIPRAWWRANDDKTIYFGIAEALQALKSILMKDRFEGVFGFSQGASMAALLSALLEKPDFHPPFLVNGEAPHPPMKFCVAVSGFKPADVEWAPLFHGGYSTPTLHVIGTNDVVVIPERSNTLIDVSLIKRVELHDGGHFVPSKANWRKFLHDYLCDPFGDVSSPGFMLTGASEPSSGVTTPAEREAHPNRL